MKALIKTHAPLTSSYRSLLVVALVISALVLAFPHVSSAATTPAGLPPYQITTLTVDNKNDFVLEPGKMEVFMNPGDTVVKYISVTSRIKPTTKFKVTTEDFVGTRSDENPVLLLGDEKSPYSFKDALVPSVGKFSLDFGDRITLPVTITAPTNALPGGYYTSVIVSNEPQVESDRADAAGAKIISRVGVLFFIRVNGPANESGHIEDLRINNPKFIYPESPASFEILFNNTGTIHLAPYGRIHISNLFGQEIDVLPVDAYFSMPDSLRYRKVEWNDDKFRFGRYKATLELNKGYGNQTDTRSITFWIIPWMVVIPVVVGIFLIVTIVYFFISKFELRRKK